MSVYERIVKALQVEADELGKRILSGSMTDWTQYKEFVAKRQATLKDIDTIKAEFGRNEDLKDD